MSKNNQIDLIELPAKSPDDIKKQVEFYSKAFDWEFKLWGDGYADTKDSGVTFGLNTSGEKLQSMPMTVIYSEDIIKAKNKIIELGGTIIHDIYSFPGGKRFHFYDPIGNEMAIWSEK